MGSTLAVTAASPSSRVGRSQSLRLRLVSAFGVGILILISTIGVGTYYLLARIEQDTWHARQLEAARYSGEIVTGFMQRIENSLDLVSTLTSSELAARPELLQSVLEREPALLELVRLDATGRVIAAASRDLSVIASLFTVLQSTWFTDALAGQRHLGDVELAPNDEPFLIMSWPSPDHTVVAARLRMTVLWTTVANIQFGASGNAYIVDSNGHIIAHTQPKIVLGGATIDNWPEFKTRLSVDQNQSVTYVNFQDMPVVGVARTLSNTGWTIVTEVEQSEAFATSRTAPWLLAIMTLIISLFSVGATVGLLDRLMLRPLAVLREGALRVGQGDLKHSIKVARHDEIGQTAEVFNRMVDELRTVYDSLEQRIATRTTQLHTSAEVGQAAASVLDPDQLLRTVVNLISERFGFYYAAIFTLDDLGRYAVLREATGAAGRTLKERHHQLEVGGQSMVGYVTAQRQARIALDAGAEAMRFDNPLLPDTRSEIALPLLVGDRVLGALDVQSTQTAAFGEAGATMLQSMADQIAVALSNAEQFKQTDAALRRSRDLYAASQALSAAAEPSDVLAALINHIAPDAIRAAITRLGPRQANGQPGHTEFVATWSHPDVESDPAMQPQIGTRLTPQQMPLVNYVKPDRPFIVPDGSSPALDPPVRDLMQRLGAQALAALPLAVGQQILGILVVGYRTPRQFDADQLQAMQTLTGQAAVVLQNLQAVADTQAALAQLDAINRRLTGEAWAGFTRRRAASSVRWIGATDQAQPIDLPEVSEALSTGQIAARPLNGSGQLGVAVPIKLHDVSIGALCLVVPQTAWNEELQVTLDSIAGHVAQAAENARLIEQTQHTAQREKQIAVAADNIHRATDLEEVLRATIAEVHRITGVSDVGIQLGDAASNGNGQASEVDL